MPPREPRGLRLTQLRVVTFRFDDMVAFWSHVLGEPAGRGPRHCVFLDPETGTRLILARVDIAAPRDPEAAGVDGVAFAIDSIAALAGLQRRLEAIGIEPEYAQDDGGGAVLWYRDPDRNLIGVEARRPGAAAVPAGGVTDPFGDDVDPRALDLAPHRKE